MISRLLQKMGRRGAFLAFLAVLDLGYGYSLIADKPSFNLLLPWNVWGWIWIGVGLFISTGILVRMDLWQYGVSALLKTTWGFVNFDSWLFREHGVSRGWVASIVWFSFAATVIVISGWPEPKRIVDIPAHEVIARAEEIRQNGNEGLE